MVIILLNLNNLNITYLSDPSTKNGFSLWYPHIETAYSTNFYKPGIQPAIPIDIRQRNFHTLRLTVRMEIRDVISYKVVTKPRQPLSAWLGEMISHNKNLQCGSPFELSSFPPASIF